MSNNPIPFLSDLFDDNEDPKKRVIRSVKAKANARRTVSEKLADLMTSHFGSMGFLIGNAAFFILWILINTNHLKGFKVFDPFPFSLLTTIVSLEAIILAIFVLISQNRAMKVDDLREEIHLQVNIIAEKEITKVMKMLAILLEKSGTDLSQDPELIRLLKPISAEELERKLEKEIL